MVSCRKLRLVVLLAVTLGLLFCAPATAQGPTDLSAQNQADAPAPPDAPQPSPSTADSDKLALRFLDLARRSISYPRVQPSPRRAAMLTRRR